MVRTLMAHTPGLARTIIMVPTGHVMHNSPSYTAENVHWQFFWKNVLFCESVNINIANQIKIKKNTMSI